MTNDDLKLNPNPPHLTPDGETQMPTLELDEKLKSEIESIWNKCINQNIVIDQETPEIATLRGRVQLVPPRLTAPPNQEAPEIATFRGLLLKPGNRAFVGFVANEIQQNPDSQLKHYIEGDTELKSVIDQVMRPVRGVSIRVHPGVGNPPVVPQDPRSREQIHYVKRILDAYRKSPKREPMHKTPPILADMDYLNDSIMQIYSHNFSIKEVYTGIAYDVDSALKKIAAYQKQRDAEYKQLTLADKQLIVAFQPERSKGVEEKVQRCYTHLGSQESKNQFLKWYTLAEQFHIADGCFVQNQHLLMIHQGNIFSYDELKEMYPFEYLNALASYSQQRQAYTDLRQDGERLVRTPYIWERLVGLTDKLVGGITAITKIVERLVVKAIAAGAVATLVVTPLMIAHAALWVADHGLKELQLEHLQRIVTPYAMGEETVTALVEKLSNPTHLALLKQFQGQSLSLTADNSWQIQIIQGDYINVGDLTNATAVAIGTGASASTVVVPKQPMTQ